MMEKNLRWLMEPIQVGSLLLQNRMVQGPMHSNLNLASGEVTQQLIDMYENGARGGPALVIIEASAVDGRHAWPVQVRIDEKQFEPGLRKLVESVHMHGVPVAIQLHHAGMWCKDAVSPSGVACYVAAQKYLPADGLGLASYLQPRVMSLAEAEEARDLFIKAAERARNVGFDGVLIHGAASYLLEQFVSPRTNKRPDRYGGSFENRIMMPLEIVRGIRRKCGPSFPIGYSLVSDELYAEGDGITLEESTAFAQALEREGVNWVDIHVGVLETIMTSPKAGTSYRQEKGLFEFSEAFKKVISVPVFARCTGENEPPQWDEAIAKGRCDVIQMGRPMLCDPELPKKVVQGRLDDIRLCIRDNYCHERGPEKGWQVACALNARWGRERDYAIERTSAPKKVLIVGGGPGGLEAARVAALRGHRVTLMEKEPKLGGNLRVASLCPGKGDYQAHFGDWLERQCQKAGVKIELGQEVTLQVVKEFKPDVVIIASGATPLIPAIPGIEKKHVVTAADVFTGKAAVGKKVVVAGGGGVGIDAADFLTEKGLAESVTVVEQLPQLASDMFACNRGYILEAVLPGAGVNTFTDMHVEEITDSGVIAKDKAWKAREFKADTVVVAMGYTPCTALYEALKGEVPELYRIGDCVEPRKIADAVREALHVAMEI